MADIFDIAGRIHSTSSEKVVTTTDELFDSELSKKQDTINSELTSDVSDLKTAVGTGGSVDSRIAAAKTEILGDASTDYNTLGKVEDSIESIDSTLENAAYLGTDSGSAVIAGFDPQSDTLWKKAQVLSTAQKNQVKTNLGLDSDFEVVYSLYRALNQSDIVVGAKPGTGNANTIYRVPGESSYTDWMYYNNSWIEMATYNNAIDNEPTAGSNNLVKSGGVYEVITNDMLYTSGYAKIELDAKPYTNIILKDIICKHGYSYKFKAKKQIDTGSDCYLQIKKKSDNTTIKYLTLSTSYAELEYLPNDDVEVYIMIYANTNEHVYVEASCPSYKDIADRLYSFKFKIQAGNNISDRIPIDNTGDVYLYVPIPVEYSYLTLYGSNQSSGNMDIIATIRKTGWYKITQNTYSYILIITGGTSASDTYYIVDYCKFGKLFVDVEELSDRLNSLDNQINNSKVFNIPSGTTGFYPASSTDGAIDESDTYYIDISSLGGASNIRFYLQTVWGSTTVGDYNFKWPGKYKVKTSSPAKFVMFQITGTTTSDVTISISKNAISNKLDYIEADYEVNKLVGKRINFLGDSIMAANADTINPGGWAEIISTNNKMFYSNGGVGGATIAVTGQAGRACILTALKQLNPAAWNYVIVQGGCNDSSLVQLGELSPDFIDEDAATNYDTSTFYGALEDMCRYMQKNFYNVKFGFIINYLFGQNANYENTNSYMQAIEDVCLKWGVPYIDLRKWASFNLICPTVRKVYGCVLDSIPVYNPSAGYNVDDRVKIENGNVFVAYKCNAVISAPAGEFNPSLWTEITDGYWWDSWHCNHLGYEVSAPKVEEFIKSL